MSDSVEQLAARARRRVALLRATSACLTLPRRLLSDVGKFLGDLDTSILIFESEAARDYHTLTGVDLSTVAGEHGRYYGSVPCGECDAGGHDD